MRQDVHQKQGMFTRYVPLSLPLSSTDRVCTMVCTNQWTVPVYAPDKSKSTHNSNNYERSANYADDDVIRDWSGIRNSSIPSPCLQLKLEIRIVLLMLGIRNSSIPSPYLQLSAWNWNCASDASSCLGENREAKSTFAYLFVFLVPKQLLCCRILYNTLGW